MSAVGSESDTPLDSQEHTPSTHGRHRNGSISNNSKRKSVIDTRRAEQNRAAQRAFRMRRDLYVKELENKVHDMEILKDRVERLELENDRLKYRVWELESSSSLPAITTNSLQPHSQPPSPSSSSSSSHFRQASSRGDTPYSNKDQQPPPPQSLPPPPPPPPLQLQQQQYHSTNSTESSSSSSSSSTTSSPPSLGPTTQQPILPPPSPSPSVFRPIPVAYWDKDGKSSKRPRSNSRTYQEAPSRRRHTDDTTPSEQGRVLDDLASILRTRHRPPIHQGQQQSTKELMHT